MRSPRSALAATVPALLLVLSLVVPASQAMTRPPGDNKAPTRPNPLRITAVGSYSVSLSWNASTDNSGAFHYVIQASSGYTMTVPQTATSATFSGSGLYPFNSYSFFVYAVDGAGNRSQNSNTVKATLPADTTVPSAPTVTVTDVGSHHVSLSWSSTDNDPYISYFVYLNGTQLGHSSTAKSGTFYMYQSSTTYTISVKARDTGINFSPLTSVTFTTEPVDLTDTEPPTTPAAFDAWHYPFDRELFLSWSQSTDNVDPREAIHYEIYINGVLAEHVVGTGQTISYGEFGSNAISIIAIDSAGNESAPFTISTDI